MRILRSVDSFDRYVSLKNKSQSKYRTCFGGIMTIVIFILMLAYFVVLVTNPLETKKTTTSSSTSTDTNTTTNTTTDTNTTSNPTTTIGDLEFEAITDYRTYSKHISRTDDRVEYDVKSGGWAFGLLFNVPYDPTILNLVFYTAVNDGTTGVPTLNVLNTTT